jgi:hypothetical protein
MKVKASGMADRVVSHELGPLIATTRLLEAEPISG